MQSAKDVAASARAGMEKTKATVQEKAEKMTTRDPLQKDIATQKKEERINEAEREKLEARERHAAEKQAGGTTGTGLTGTHLGTTGGLTGSTQDPLGPTSGTTLSGSTQDPLGTAPGTTGHHDPSTGRTGYRY